MKSQLASIIEQTFNGRAEWGIPGGYFKLLSAPAAPALELWNEGRIVLRGSAVSAGFYQRIDFDKIVITNPGAQAISFLAAGDEGGSDNFTGTFTAQGTLGTLAQDEVSGVNALVTSPAPADYLTDDNHSFSRGQVVAAVAAQFSHSQVKNPAASGKTVYVDAMTIGGTVADLFSYGHRDVDLGILSGTLNARLNGGAAASAQLRNTTNAADLITTPIGLVRVLAGQSERVVFDPPIKLAAGQGFGVRNNTLNQAHECTFEIREY